MMMYKIVRCHFYMRTSFVIILSLKFLRWKQLWTPFALQARPLISNATQFLFYAMIHNILYVEFISFFLVQCSTDDKDKWITHLPVTLEQLYPVCSWQKYNFLLLCFISQLPLHFTIYSNLATIRPASCKPWHFSTFFRITRPKFPCWTVFYFRL